MAKGNSLGKRNAMGTGSLPSEEGVVLDNLLDFRPQLEHEFYGSLHPFIYTQTPHGPLGCGRPWSIAINTSNKMDYVTEENNHVQV